MEKILELYEYIHLSIHSNSAYWASKIGTDILIITIAFIVIYITPFLIWQYFYSTYCLIKKLIKLITDYFYIIIKIVKTFLKLLHLQVYVFIVGFILLIIWLTGVYLDPFEQYSLHKTKLDQSSIVTDAEDNVLDYFFDTTIRIWTPIEKIDPKLISLIIFAEDDKFYEHSGFDILEILASIKKNYTKRKYARGASTITQQLAKNSFLTKEKTLKRKLKEVMLALKLENNLSKNDIIKLYMNTVEWGPGIYGIEAASRYYFDKSAEALTSSQMQFLTLILPNPKLFSPFYNPQNMKRIKSRQKAFIHRLYIEKKICIDERKKMLNSRFWFYSNRNPKNLKSNFPKLDSVNVDEKIFLFSGLEKYLIKRHGKETLYQKGMNIKVTINKKRQKEIFDLSSKINKQTDYNNNNLNFVAVYSPNNVITAFAQLVDSDVDNIKKLMANLLAGEKLGKIYKINEIPWNSIIISSKRLPSVTLKP